MTIYENAKNGIFDYVKVAASAQLWAPFVSHIREFSQKIVSLYVKWKNLET